ncbi:MAG: HsdR family type I site-specific deoxyribonuclease [Paludibacteraceae bacterium]|nr:HsdR family type I site-specific deoxyribonuclease [Paludibacteraceae bacterium]
MDDYRIILEEEHQTVMAHYEVKAKPSEGYQSETQLETAFINQLMAQGYVYRIVKNEEGLLRNLREQLEALNNIQFSDSEWARLLPQISNEQMTIQDKTEMLQGKGYILALKLDNGETKNIKLVDKQNVYNNRLQVTNQYEEPGGAHKNRYDVTILVNGLPMVHVELKRRGQPIKEAFNQINRYQRDSFWAGKAMFDFIQVFVISNGTETKYYSNTTRYAKEQETESIRKRKTDGNSFEFTSYWSDQENNRLTDLRDFTTGFFAKHTILNILTKYCVFNVDKQLLVMRPYQIAATEKILLRIQTAINNKWQGSIKAGGYIWHTTGSGKTLTSFKTAQLASKMEHVKKVLFVVDRKDLDYQTMKEYNNFEPDCANSNTSARVLLRQMKDENCNIIITTIQKLSNLMKPNIYDNDEELRKVLQKDNIVLIFDECHRSQFGEMHQLITKRMKRYLMFGFTGTPIFAVNANKGSKYSTTAQLFGGEPDDEGKPTKPLHTYTIINAIGDNNVLRFHVDYDSTMKMKSDVERKQVWGIDTEEALHDPRRISVVTRYIIDHFGEKTKQEADAYSMSRLLNVHEVVKRGRNAEEKKHTYKTKGFNSIFAVDSVKSAILYYNEFKKQLAEPGAPNLRVATIFTYSANEEEVDEWGFEEGENPENTEGMDVQSREALEAAIKDYNELYGVNYSTDGDNFQSYYKDVSLRMKNKDIDLLIVVGMFLTGFDAKTLNTLWVDKNLKLHGLLQAYSRTNRILNSVKDCGNIVCFRNLKESTDKSLAIFGDPNAKGLVFMKSYDEYYRNGYEDAKGKHQRPYIELIATLLAQFPVEKMGNILDEEEKKDFIRLMGEILRLRNILSVFDAFDEEAKIVPEMDYQDYLGWYNQFYEELRKQRPDKEMENIVDDIVFEIELVRHDQINIHYILALVQRYHDSNCEDKEIIVKIRKQIDASPDMRDKRELIEKFIEQMTPDKGVDVGAEWNRYIERQKREELDAIIAEEHLKHNETVAFMQRAFMDGYVTETGTGIARILPATNPFLPESGARKQSVLQKLKEYLKKFLGTTEEMYDLPDVAEQDPAEDQHIIPLYPTYQQGCVPLYSLHAACGYFEDGEVPEAEGYVDASGNGFTPDPKRYFAVHAKGDSMLPKIKDGNICVFEWYHAGSRDGEIVLTQCRDNDPDYAGRYTIKKYHSEKVITDEGWQHAKVELIPLNSDYDTISLDTDADYKTIGILKCVLKYDEYSQNYSRTADHLS